VDALPGGTVTFLFSDIEGSTRLLEQLGDRYGDVHRDHRRILRDELERAEGREVDTQGDAFFFSFTRAKDAVRGAVAAQRALGEHEWPDGAEVKVRMGLHTGEPTVGEEGYVGMDVVRAARICSAGHGGQILLSETTRALVGASLPEGVSIFPLGERRLKDIDEPERVFELEIEGAAAPAEAEAAADVDEPQVPTPPEPPAPEMPQEFGARLSEQIEARVRRSVERSLEHAFSEVDRIAERAARRPEKITERLDEDS
jgi:class 3 adenylate cyclase